MLFLGNNIFFFFSKKHDDVSKAQFIVVMHSLTTQHVKNVLLWRLCDSYSILQEDYFNRFYSYVIPFWLRKKLLAPYLTQSPHSILYVKPKLSLYSPTRAVTSLRGPYSRLCASWRHSIQLLSKKRCSGGEPLATLCPI